MKLTVTTSTGAKILIWREEEMFHARPASTAGDVQICLAIDLFEVIAELGGLDLEQDGQAAEAIALAEDAQRRLAHSQLDDHIHQEQSRNAGRNQESRDQG
jgi:hypothetical protein